METVSELFDGDFSWVCLRVYICIDTIVTARL